MDENVGTKIKGLAKVLGWLLLIVGGSAFLYFIGNGEYFTDDDYIGWIALVSGVLGYISSWMLYGFGQAIEDIHKMRELAEGKTEAVSEETSEE